MRAIARFNAWQAQKLQTMQTEQQNKMDAIAEQLPDYERLVFQKLQKVTGRNLWAAGIQWNLTNNLTVEGVLTLIAELREVNKLSPHEMTTTVLGFNIEHPEL